ncbi:uncharacterized protein N7525_005575 [Penicillium rubens]|uniref:uncharacterized protein n=1 Tax=Penicillium rubens TaxID=1108849 RepID=UPI002A5A7AC2|nr:uncharacterized protein N7525_005575 [Penicillium rubens]KAJ5840387.1 hypothetical protein N7525_005575 [Penicillium rubens]KAJ5868366.1 hypothetical protein N7534_002919 [Penicillium rubens]
MAETLEVLERSDKSDRLWTIDWAILTGQQASEHVGLEGTQVALMETNWPIRTAHRRHGDPDESDASRAESHASLLPKVTRRGKYYH